MAVQPTQNTIDKCILEVRGRSVAVDPGLSEAQHNSAYVLMLEFDRATVSSRILQQGLERSIVLCLIERASGQLFDQHRKVICDDQVYFEISPRFRHDRMLSSLPRADRGRSLPLTHRQSPMN